MDTESALSQTIGSDSSKFENKESKFENKECPVPMILGNTERTCPSPKEGGPDMVVLYEIGYRKSRESEFSQVTSKHLFLERSSTLDLGHSSILKRNTDTDQHKSTIGCESTFIKTIHID